MATAGQRMGIRQEAQAVAHTFDMALAARMSRAHRVVKMERVLLTRWRLRAS
jgi:hypothetical protein